MAQPPAGPPPEDSGVKGSRSGASGPGGTALDHPPTAQEAIDAFRRFWDEELVPGGNPSVARHTPLVKSMQPSAALRSFAEYRQLVRDRLGTPESNPAVLFGELDLLQGEGRCWAVHFDGLLSGGVGGCVDARDGRILFVWETPEG